MRSRYGHRTWRSMFSSLCSPFVANDQSETTPSSKTRRLRIEQCESRNLLAAIAGTKFEDLTGDGFSPDDLPLAGTTIELYKDGGDKIFNFGSVGSDDLFVDTTVTSDGTGSLSLGEYSFDDVDSDRYFVREQVPANMTQTAGPAFYTVDVIGSMVYKASDVWVDKFDAPNPQKIFIIDYQDPNPTFDQTNDSEILSGQRDLYLEVGGVSGMFSATVDIGTFNGTGRFNFGTASPGAKAILQYDGFDAGISNALAMTSDVTVGGTMTGFRLDFSKIEAASVTTLDMRVSVTDSDSNSASVLYAIPESASPSTFFVPFSDFSGISFDRLTSLQFTFNENTIDDTDFVVNGILPSAPSDDKFDFGNMLNRSSLSGYVYVDVNNNGIKDPPEWPIANVKIQLDGTDDLGQTVGKSTTTDVYGYYLFDNLRPGTYQIVEIQPAEYIDGKDTIGTPGGVTSNDKFSQIMLPVEFDGVENNFGELGHIVISKISFLSNYDPPKPWETRVVFTLTGDPDEATDITTIPGVALLDTTLQVDGTSGDDTFEFDMTNDGYVVKINGKPLSFSTDTISSIKFDGAAGEDTAILRGSNGSESVIINPTSATFSGDGITVDVSSTSRIEAYGEGGDDTASFFDSPGDDVFTSNTTSSQISGDSFSNLAYSFEKVYATSNAGGNDVAKLYDTPGDDKFVATPSYGKLSGNGLYYRAIGFNEVRAFSTAGGLDSAYLYDSADDDKCISTPLYTKIYNDSFYLRASRFDVVKICANNGGTDEAMVFDSSGDDILVTGASSSRLYGEGFYNRAMWFEKITTYSTAGGIDVAYMYDSPGNDTFVSTPGYGKLYGNGFYTRANFFDRVKAYATNGGNDIACFYDSAGNDVFETSPECSKMSGNDFHNSAAAFDRVFARCNAGGFDTAYVYDTPGNDHISAADTWAILAAENYRVNMVGFDSLAATSSLGGSDTRSTKATDFVLQFFGPWINV